MGLTAIGVSLVKDKIKGADVLCLGYPDIRTLELPYEVEKTRARAEKHGGGWCPDTDEFFEKLGAKSVTYIDVDSFHGKERIVDLNYPAEIGKYDLIIDPGTLEHCFNVGQAWMTVAESLRVDGHIYHCNPMTMVNHGFWNFCPTVYRDFYKQNGFDYSLYLQKMPYGGRKPDDNIYTTGDDSKRMLLDSECMSHVIAKRKTNDPIQFPTQTKYL